MYRNLEEFLMDGNDIEDIAVYDFKNEAPWAEVRREKDAIKKFIRYRSCVKKRKRKFDCDNSNGTCPLSNDIYKKLWGWDYKSRFTLTKHLKDRFGDWWTRLGSDTANSFYTTYKQAVEIYGDSRTANKNLYLQEFASLTHTIGNFTLVPFKLREDDEKSFNQYRGANFGKYFVYDYFDLSLKLIKENISEAGFRAYIDTFFLNDYVDSDYNIKPLFKRHGEMLEQERLLLDEPQNFLPQNEDELNEYLENVIGTIQRRSIRILTVLEEIIDENKIKKREKRKIFFSKIRKKILSFVFLVFALWVVIGGVGAFKLCERLGGFKYLVKQHGFFEMVSALWEEFAETSFSLAVSITIFVIILFWIIHFFWIRFANAKLQRCTKCKRLFAQKKVKTEEVDIEDISILVETKRRNADGEVIGTDEQYIPGTRTTYKDTCVCKFCGSRQTRTRTVDRKNI